MKNVVSVLLLLVVVVYCAPSLMAQRRFEANIIAGLTASQINGDRSAGYNKLGLQAGGQGLIILNEKMRASVGILYTQRGSQNQLNPNSAGNQFSLRLNYIEVPLLFHFLDWKKEDGEDSYYRLHFHGGFSYGNLINYSLDDDLSAINLIAPSFKKNDFSLNIGVNYFFKKNWGAGFRYTRAMNALYDPTDFPSATFTSAWLAHNLNFYLVYAL